MGDEPHKNSRAPHLMELSGHSDVSRMSRHPFQGKRQVVECHTTYHEENNRDKAERQVLTKEIWAAMVMSDKEDGA